MATKKLKELIMNSKILKEPIVYDCLQAKIAENLGFQAIGGGLSWGSSIIKFGKPIK